MFLSLTLSQKSNQEDTMLEHDVAFEQSNLYGLFQCKLWHISCEYKIPFVICKSNKYLQELECQESNLRWKGDISIIIFNQFASYQANLKSVYKIGWF